MGYKLKITDELGFDYNFEFKDYNSVLKEIKNWLKTHESGETPIYYIKIETL